MSSISPVITSFSLGSSSEDWERKRLISPTIFSGESWIPDFIVSSDWGVEVNDVTWFDGFKMDDGVCFDGSEGEGFELEDSVKSETGKQIINDNLSTSSLQDLCIECSSSRLKGSEAVSFWICCESIRN
jgi:hypothetical protein